MTSMTTIKVSTDVRDRLNSMAAERGITANSVVERLLEDALWNQRMEDVRAAMASASEEDLSTYREETADWIAVAAPLAEGR